jgi:ribosomal protein S18 acetylase RimI-like enzyme
MAYQIRAAAPAELAPLLELFPRLADFDLPPERLAEDLWRGDAELLRMWAAGEAPGCLVYLAADADGGILGVALARLREELISHAPSAHLEVLAVRAGAEGQGIGGALIRAAEREVRARGALSMTLHVFSSNARARALYERHGYAGELIRYIKHLG